MATPVPSNIDVVKYKQSLIQWLKTYPQFTDYDFEGSNFNVLIGLLAYNAYNLAHYDNMVGSEAWIDTAELRQSQVSHATDLNYLPRSRVSAQSVIEVEVYPTDNPTTIILPKYFKFKSSDNNGNTVYFVTNQDYITTRDTDGRYIFKNVDIFQGEIVEEFFEVSGVTIENGVSFYDRPFVISSSDIDIKSLEVFVQQSSSDSSPVEYDYSKTLDQTSSVSTTYFLRGIYDDQYAIEFGDGTFGAAVQNGNIVNARYRVTQGPVVQGNYVITPTTSISGYANITINSATRVQGGFERETVEQLRFVAPKYFQTQDRAITADDYAIIVKQGFPNIQQVYAFGGEEIEQYGKVMIVLKPFGTIGVVSDIIKSQIIELLKTKNIVPEPVIIDPNYYYIGVTTNVFYNADVLKITEQQLKTNITNNLVNLNNTVIGNFNISVYQSLINNTINKSDSSIEGSDTTLDLRKRWTPQRNLNETLSFTTNNPFDTSKDGPFQDPNDYTITSSLFSIFFNGVATNVVIQDDGIGNLYYFSVNSSGVKVRIGQSIGTINYQTGSVNLVANILDYSNYIEFIISLQNKSIAAIRQTFMIIAGENIYIDTKRI